MQLPRRTSKFRLRGTNFRKLSGLIEATASGSHHKRETPANQSTIPTQRKWTRVTNRHENKAHKIYVTDPLRHRFPTKTATMAIGNFRTTITIQDCRIKRRTSFVIENPRENFRIAYRTGVIHNFD